MSKKMCYHVGILLQFSVLLVFSGSEGSVANLLADRALAKLSGWIDINGPIWLSLPGHFQQGQVHNVGNKFTLAFSGPKLSSIGSLSRSGEATLDDAEPDPLYKSSQKLRFTSTLHNVTVIYPKVAYTEDDFGSYNFTPVASTETITVEMELAIKGDMETCVGFPDAVNVNSNSITVITVGDKDTDHKVPAVIGAVTSHFKNNVVGNLQTLLESGTFNSLDNYDICNDVYNPLLPANMFAEQILTHLVEGIKGNLSNWAWLPGFWKQFHSPNGTVTNFLRVDVGNFSSIGEIRRIGDASYSNDANQSITMNFQIDSLTAFYRSIYFTDHTTQYNLSDTITTSKVSISLTVPFFKSPYSRFPSCNKEGLRVAAAYGGGQVQAELLPSLPQELFNMVNASVVEGLLQSLEEAARDLFLTAASSAVTVACPKNSNVLPPANDMADKVLAAMAELLKKHASDWTHLPGSWRQYFAPNGTLIYYIAAGFGNFTGTGAMQRISAEYGDDNSYLNIVFETESMSAIYGDVLYTSNWVQYKMVETVKTQKLRTSLSISFSPQGGSGVPSCYGGSVGSAVYYEGGDVELSNLTPGVPDDVQALVKSQLSEEFLNDFSGAVEELHNQVAINALPLVCDRPVLPLANDMADKVLNAMAELLVKHSSDWTHLPGSWKQYFAPNDTLIYYIAAGFGNFTGTGAMQRISAAYNDDNSSLNIVFETESMSAIYGDVVYTSNWVQYKMVETVKTQKLKTSLSISFSPLGSLGVPTCWGGSVSSMVSYEGGDIELSNLTPGVPDDVQALVKSQISEEFLKNFSGAVEELHNQVAINVLPQVCM